MPNAHHLMEMRIDSSTFTRMIVNFVILLNVQFFVNFLISDGHFHLLDGDKICALLASYIQESLKDLSIPATLGVVQTAYANGSSTTFMEKALVLSIMFQLIKIGSTIADVILGNRSYMREDRSEAFTQESRRVWCWCLLWSKWPWHCEGFSTYQWNKHWA